jgi:hypothetical protein
MIELIEVNTAEQKSLVKNIIENNHSYVPTNSSVGRRIDWLIFEHKDDSLPECIGMIGIGSSVYPPPKDILRFLGVSKDEYKNKVLKKLVEVKYCNLLSNQEAQNLILI